MHWIVDHLVHVCDQVVCALDLIEDLGLAENALAEMVSGQSGWLSRLHVRILGLEHMFIPLIHTHLGRFPMVIQTGCMITYFYEAFLVRFS